jgi:hypothetical protein
LIIDNASEVNSELLVKAVISDAVYYRNSINIGMSGNFIKCFELCETEWLWILGDDDVVSEDAVTKVLTEIKKYPEATYINFCCKSFFFEKNPSKIRAEEVLTRGLDEFIDSIDHFQNINFISLGVYRHDALRKYINVGYDYGYSLINFLAMLFAALGTSGVAVLSPSTIIELHNPNVSWSRLRYTWTVSTVLDLPMSGRTRKILKRHIKATSLRFKTLATILLERLRRNEIQMAEAEFNLALVYKALHDDLWVNRLRYPVYLLCINNPIIFKLLTRIGFLRKILFNFKSKTT